jgi:hypothetical protein
VEGESIAILEAMKAKEQRDLSNINLKNIQKSTVDAIQILHGGFSEFSSIINHIKDILSSNPNFKVKFFKRQTNIVAHTLIRMITIELVVFLKHYICIYFLLNNKIV